MSATCRLSLAFRLIAIQGHDGSIPEGQAIVSAELAEAYEIIKLLAEEIEHAEEEKEG